LEVFPGKNSPKKFGAYGGFCACCSVVAGPCRDRVSEANGSVQGEIRGGSSFYVDPRRSLLLACLSNILARESKLDATRSTLNSE
jgi:hypothetical protein